MGRKRKTDGHDDAANGQAADAKTPEERQQERRDRFLRLAPKRVQKAIKSLDAVARLANRASYEYTDDESKRIQAAVNDATEACLRELAGVSKKATVFSL